MHESLPIFNDTSWTHVFLHHHNRCLRRKKRVRPTTRWSRVGIWMNWVSGCGNILSLYFQVMVNKFRPNFTTLSFLNAWKRATTTRLTKTRQGIRNLQIGKAVICKQTTGATTQPGLALQQESPATTSQAEMCVVKLTQLKVSLYHIEP